MNKFIMYELNRDGLQTFMAGSNSLRYADRYVVKDIDFTDNSKKFTAHMRADSGVYKSNIVDLKGNIKYSREDGLEIESQTLQYNLNRSIAKTEDHYILTMQGSEMQGSAILYDAYHKTLKSKNVVVQYNLKEREK